MKEIKTLIPDIYSLISSKEEWFNAELADLFSKDVSARLVAQLGHRRDRPTLRLSKLGAQCPCALWYSINKPDLAEPIPPWATIKYSYGHILEALLITLAKATGHKVEGEQDRLVLDDIVGHRDCVIDGCTVDVKSAATMSFNRFKSGSFQDTFGYLDQLDGYVTAAKDDPKVTHKDVGYIFAVDKTLGHLCLYKHEITHEREATLRHRIAAYKRIVGQPSPPPCECRVIPQGSSGNLQLDIKAGYSPYKHCCFPHLRTFLYASGPVHLARVVRKPEVTEVDKNGKIVYN